MTDDKDIQELLRRKERAITEMGGLDKIEAQHRKGRLTARERIHALLDPGSFFELGALAHSERDDVADRSPGDGKIIGLGTINGRKVGVGADDVTVFHASSSYVGMKKVERIEHLCYKHGFPFIFLGECGGARIPDIMTSRGLPRFGVPLELVKRNRTVPMITAILGESFGGSSWYAVVSDFVVQVRGTSMAVSSPRVIEVATGERTDFEDLGGVEVHAQLTGQLDIVAEEEMDAFEHIRRWLSFMPQNAESLPVRTAWDEQYDVLDETLPAMVPKRRNRGYDMRRLIPRLTDDETFFELRPQYGPSLITALARIGGRAVGIIASNPYFFAGSIDAAGCDKATHFTCLCEAFNIPMIYLQDVPGFFVGRDAERAGIITKILRWFQALALATMPKVTIIIRKAYGMAFFSMAGTNSNNDFIYAWPGADISFIDPRVGVNVVHGKRIAAAADPDAERERILAEGTEFDTAPWGAAGDFHIDDVIDPRATRSVIIRSLDYACSERFPRPVAERPLVSWPLRF
ncbi:MAG: acyl-CoA carboxylase subunit beta [Candidatus Binatia bacterium]